MDGPWWPNNAQPYLTPDLQWGCASEHRWHSWMQCLWLWGRACLMRKKIHQFSWAKPRNPTGILEPQVRDCQLPLTVAPHESVAFMVSFTPEVVASRWASWLGQAERRATGSSLADGGHLWTFDEFGHVLSTFWRLDQCHDIPWTSSVKSFSALCLSTPGNALDWAACLAGLKLKSSFWRPIQ